MSGSNHVIRTRDSDKPQDQEPSGPIESPAPQTFPSVRSGLKRVTPHRGLVASDLRGVRADAGAVEHFRDMAKSVDPGLFRPVESGVSYTALRYNNEHWTMPRMPKKTGAKKATFGADLLEGMKLVLAHQRGKIEVEQVWPKPIDVRSIRKRVKMSQAEFSRAYGISKRALQEWEQGGRQPDSAARAYLTVIAREPAVVRRALAKA
jgi:putative transcriptional regulator